MIDRAERAGLGVALVGHVLLFAALSLSLFSTARLPPITQEPMDVILTDDIGLRSSVPEPAVEPPAPSVAPEVGAPEEPAPAPEPEPAPPAPAPTPKPTRSDVPAVPKPAPAPKPAEKPEPKKAEDLTDRRRPDKATSRTRATTPARSNTAAGTATAEKPRGSRLGQDFLKGISDAPAGKAQTPRAAVSGQAMQGLAAALVRQFRPCYELGSLQGTPAMSIVTTLRLRYRKDGTVAGTPEVAEQTGVNESNRSYAQQMSEVSRRAVLRCSPVRLPAELYEGGWDNFNLRFVPNQLG